MNTLAAGWVDEEFKKAIKNRNEGNRRTQPFIDMAPEFNQIMNSQLGSISRSVFTSRLRRRD